MRHRQHLSQARNLGLAIASACAHSDSELAATAFRKLASVRSVWNANVDGVDLYRYALFSAADGADIDALRQEEFLRAEDDKAIAAIVLAAERHAPEWLDGYMPKLTQSRTAADHALAITIEGFRLGRSGDEALAAREPTGFLGASQKAASESSRRTAWCEHWLRRAQESETPEDFWRFTVLAQGAIDPRQVSTAKTALSGGRWARFANPLLRDIEKTAEKAAKQRERTLFGVRAPDAELRAALFPF